jgi:hypothetical protein
MGHSAKDFEKLQAELEAVKADLATAKELNKKFENQYQALLDEANAAQQAMADKIALIESEKAKADTFGASVAEGERDGPPNALHSYNLAEYLAYEQAPHLDPPADGHGVYFQEREGFTDANGKAAQMQRYVGRDLAHAVGYAARYGTADFSSPPKVTLWEANGSVTVELPNWNELNALALLVRDGGRIEMKDGGHRVSFPSLFAATADPS